MRQPLSKKKVKKYEGLKASPPPLGKSHTQRMSSKIAGRNAELFERQATAVRMASRGATFEQIASALGYSDKGDAHRDVMQALAAAREQCRIEAEQYRAIKLYELNLMRLQAHRIIEGQDTPLREKLAAIDRVVRIQEREARLLGLDAPVRSELSGPGGKPILIDVDSLSHEQIARLSAGDTSVLYPVGGSAVGESAAYRPGAEGSSGSN